MGIEHVVHTPSPALKGLCPAAQISWDKPIYDLHFNTGMATCGGICWNQQSATQEGDAAV